METDTEILNIRLSQEMVEWIDSLVKKGLYKSRAEVIRDFTRQYLELQEPRDITREERPGQ